MTHPSPRPTTRPSRSAAAGSPEPRPTARPLFAALGLALLAPALGCEPDPQARPPRLPPPPAVTATVPPPVAAPPVDDGIEAAVRSVVEIKRSFGPKFSPDGKRIAYVSDESGVPQVWVIDVAGGAPRQLTKLADPVGGVAWSPDGANIAFGLAPGGGMNQQVYLVKAEGSEPKRITDGGKENNWLGDFSRDGKVLTFSSNRREPASMDAYVFDVASEKAELVAKNPGTGAIAGLSRDRKKALLSRSKQRGNGDLFLVELAKSKEVLLTPHEGPGTFFGELTPDGKTVYLGSNKGRDLIAFARVKIGANGAPGAIETVAARDDAELATFAIDEAATTAALLWNVAGLLELSFVDLATGKARPGPKLPAERAAGLTFSKDGSKLAMTVVGATAPADIWVLEVKSGAFKRLTGGPGRDALASLPRPELVRFQAHDGVALSGWLYRPVGAKGPGPIVLSFHGGPEGQEVPVFRDDYQALLAQGIAVFAPNVRGSSGFGKTFVNLDNGAKRVDAVRDIKACLDQIVRSGVADPARVGIMGGSYGGYMVMAGLTEYPESFAAGANLFGVVNFETFFKHTEGWMAAVSKVEYGDPVTEAEMLRKLSPLNRIDRVVAPTIVLHGQNDTNVPVIEAEQVVASLKKRNVPVEYVLFPDEGHGFRKLENRVRANTATVRWFVRHLKKGAPAPG